MPNDTVVPLARGHNYGRRFTLEQRLRMRAGQSRRYGRADDWGDEALDFFLAGLPVPEIADTYNCSVGSIYNAISKAALFRLMKQHQAERLDELRELQERIP